MLHRMLNLLFRFTQFSYSLNRTRISVLHHENLYNFEGVYLQGTVFAENSQKTEITVTMYSCNVAAARLVQFAKCSEGKYHSFSKEA